MFHNKSNLNNISMWARTILVTKVTFQLLEKFSKHMTSNNNFFVIFSKSFRSIISVFSFLESAKSRAYDLLIKIFCKINIFMLILKSTLDGITKIVNFNIKYWNNLKTRIKFKMLDCINCCLQINVEMYVIFSA